MQTFKGSKFLLRELDFVNDKKAICTNINDKDILDKIALEYPYTEENYESIVKKIKESKEKTPREEYQFVIDVNGEAVGLISLIGSNKLEKKHRAEIGYWLAKKHWGQGIMGEAVKILENFAFNDLKLFKLTIGALYDNIGSMKVAKKNGFELEYIVKKAAFKAGEYKDLVYYTKFNF